VLFLQKFSIWSYLIEKNIRNQGKKKKHLKQAMISISLFVEAIFSTRLSINGLPINAL